jgi:type II secretory pathway pseudopilin PulG
LLREVTRPSRDEREVRGVGVSLAWRRNGAERGATLFAVAIGVFATGVVLAIATPLVQQSRRGAVAGEVVEDLRHFAAAFQAHAQRRGDWPPAATAAGQVPAGMEKALDHTWQSRTPIGGGYLWAPETLQRGRRYHATILLCHVTGNPVATDRRLLEEIDRQIDDGDLENGSFLLGYRNQPFFVIEP